MNCTSTKLRPEDFPDAGNIPDKWADFVKVIRKAAREEMREEAARVCEATGEAFFGQPPTHLLCARQIRALP